MLNPGVLVSALYRKHFGKPILVIGGGPSAPEQLHRLGSRVADMLVISANGHAWSLGLRPDYTFCKDHLHTETQQPMEVMLRAHDQPIVAWHYWADYRAAKWPIQGNSGMHAIALAALMGGSPIVPIGIDCFQGATYFHSPNVSNVSLGRPPGYWKSRMERLAGRLEGATIRPISGPLAAVFPKYHPHETLPDTRIPRIFDPYDGMATHYVRALKPFVLAQDPRAPVPVGRVFPVTGVEAALFTRQGVAVAVGNTDC